MGGKALWSDWTAELMSHMLRRLNGIQPQGLRVRAAAFSGFILSPSPFPVGKQTKQAPL